MQDLSMPGDTDVFLDNFLHYECRSKKEDSELSDEDIEDNNENELMSKLDNFLTFLLNLEKDCPYRIKVTHSYSIDQPLRVK
jgi:hypothetical protein